MIVVGLTGNAASGKSTAAGFFRDFGAKYISTDKLAKNLINFQLAQIISKTFAIPLVDGKPDNDKLRATVLSDSRKLAELNSITHPAVTDKLRRIFDKLGKFNDILIVECALIYDIKIEKLFDYVVIVKSDIEARRRRLGERGLSNELIDNLQKKQLSQENYLHKGDFIIDNNEDLDYFRVKCYEIYSELIKRNDGETLQ